MRQLKYFDTVLDQTMSLLKKKGNSKCNVPNDVDDVIEANILAIKYMINMTDDPGIKTEMKKRARSVIQMSDDDEDNNGDPGLSSEIKEVLKRELVSGSRLLHRKVKIFKEKLKKDSEIIKNVGSAMNKNFLSTRISADTITKSNKKQPLSGLFFLVIVVFLIVYIIIRFA